MKKLLLICAACLFLSLNVHSQCTPTGGGTPGVTPTPDNVTCIERGVPYDITMQLVNFTTIQGLATMNWARIDSLVNFPCGITWQANKLQFNGGETGCIRVSGTTNDSVGQYPLGIYMTVNLSALGQTIEQGGEIGNLLSQLQSQFGINLGLDIGYYTRVIDPGNSCPPIDRTITANNLTSSGATCTTAGLSVSISGNTAICSGSSTTLTANVTGNTGAPTYTWSPGGGSAQTKTVNPSTTTTYSVTVNDQNGSATASATVTLNQRPSASFTASASGAVATINNTTAGASSYSWNFGDTQTSFSQNPSPHTYSSNGNFTITLIATNSCGSDTATQQVTITGASGPSVTITGNTAICAGSSTTLTANVTNATGTPTYTWSPGGGSAQTKTVNPTSTTTYSVTVNAQNGSANASSTVTVNQLPTSSFTYTVQGLTVTFTNTSTGATSYLWEFGPGGGTSTSTNPTHAFPSAGSYDVRLTATNSCGNTEDSEPDVLVPPTTGVDVVSQGTIDISPNPTKGQFEIRLNNITGNNLLLTVLDLSGKSIYSEVVQTGYAVHELNLSGLSKGVYVISFSNNYETLRKKLIIF